MISYLSAMSEALIFALTNLVWIFAVLWGVERLYPRGHQPTKSEYLTAAKFIVLSAVFGAAISTAFDRIAEGREPLLAMRLPHAGWALYVVGPVAFFYFYDFFNYWMHRAQHKWFWRQHAVHHAIENISGVNSYFHWSEAAFRIAFISAPMTFFLGFHAGGATLVSAIVTTAYGNFIHSPTTINLGPVSRFIVDNRWHRIHHSREARHWDKNFGTSVTLWDHLFGTAYVPAPDEWPDCGVPGAPQLTTVHQYLQLGHPDVAPDLVATTREPSC